VIDDVATDTYDPFPSRSTVETVARAVTPRSVAQEVEVDRWSVVGLLGQCREERRRGVDLSALVTIPGGNVSSSSAAKPSGTALGSSTVTARAASASPPTSLAVFPLFMISPLGSFH